MKTMKTITFLIFLFLGQILMAQTINWSYDIGFDIKPQVPAIADDGTIYIGSEDNDNFHAINPDGSLKWTYTLVGDNIYSSASVGTDGTIYVGTKQLSLHAINPDGSQKWVFDMGSDAIYASPAIATDGTIYIGSDDDNFYAVNQDGTQKWSFTTGGNVRSTPAIATDGTVYVASDDDNLYALNPADGSLAWSYNIGGDVEGCVVLDEDGTIFVGVDRGTPNGAVVALNPDGTLKWESANTGRVLSSPAIANNTIYFGTKDTNNLYALDITSGNELWSFNAGDIILSSPAVGDDGKIYFGSFDDNLYCLNPDGSLNFSTTLTAGENLWSSPVITTDGDLIIGSYDGKLYSVDIPSTGLANSNWPMFGKNLQHTSSDNTLSINNFLYNNSIETFYTDGILNISIENYNDDAIVNIYDLNGRKIEYKVLEFQSNEFSKLPLYDLTSGIYIVQIISEKNNFIHSNKFVVNN